MAYFLTSKSQVTIPKAVRIALNVGPGQAVDFELQSDGNVRLIRVETSSSTENPFKAFVGKGVAGKSTEHILTESRGKGWNK